MPFAVPLIEENSLRSTADGFEVKVRLNWYRSLPLSCIENIRLVLDGEEISADALSFAVNEHSFPVRDLAGRTGEYWYVQDSGVIQAQYPGKVAAGGSYTVEAEITIRAPYILIGPGKFLTMPTRYSTIQVAA
jgi:hypothetical protein